MHLSEEEKEGAGKNFKTGQKKKGGKLEDALGKVRMMEGER